MGIKQLLPARLRVAMNTLRNDAREVRRAFEDERVEVYRVSDGRAYARHEGEAARARDAGEAVRAPDADALDASEAAGALDAGEAASAPVDVERVIVFRKSGVELSIDDDQTILEAGLRNGVDLMFSCTLGGCAACILEVVEGEVEYDDPYAIVLTEEERDEGYCLACVGKPRGRVVVEA